MMMPSLGAVRLASASASFGTGERRFGPFQLGIGLGNLFRAVAGFELGELLASRAYLRLGLIPLGAGGIELTAGDGAGGGQCALAAPLLVSFQRCGFGGGQCSPGAVGLFAAIAFVDQGVGGSERSQIGAGTVAAVGEGRRIEAGQQLAGFYPIPLIDQYLIDAAADPKGQIDVANIDVAVEDGAVGRAPLPPEITADNG